MFPTLARHLVGLEHTPVSQILQQIASVFWDPEAWLCVHICDCTPQSRVGAVCVCLCVHSTPVWVCSTYKYMRAFVTCLYPGSVGGTLSSRGKVAKRKMECEGALPGMLQHLNTSLKGGICCFRRFS